ncbi:RNA methyltransferase [Maribellus sp. YY47]|uniref:TrmH family RNA methyltransferase n=1 Tax=Maribellus sp. YY47 TaxID=2929486 RepID=UPI002001615E|nr:RNA methyltransferase [Maribellus sp. YY47]MCK3686226.1 RNA methyltransferase [Maribellus sp. YY47]
MHKNKEEFLTETVTLLQNNSRRCFFSMISKSKIKQLSSLALKKYRNKEGLFLVEGDKMVLELAKSKIRIAEIMTTEAFEPSIRDQGLFAENTTTVTRDELKKISQLKTPQNSLAVCYLPVSRDIPEVLEEDLTIYLDGIQDPGNLGTILRICDWFGIPNIFCSAETVDPFNPKVIQASMGSFARVTLTECDFDQIRTIATNSGAIIYGTFMEGENVYTQDLSSKSILVMGNEGNGISEKVKKHVDQKISIPNFSSDTQKAESLNVSVATAILCSEFKRRSF